MTDLNRFQFNKEKLLALPLPEVGKRATYHDTKAHGLQLRVTSTGVKTFSMYRRTKGGAPERVTLGRFPTMTVEQARKAASVVNASIEGGDNPAEVKRVFKAEPTFAELFKEYGERHGINKRTWKNDLSTYANHLQSLAPRKLTSDHAGDDCPSAFQHREVGLVRLDGAQCACSGVGHVFVKAIEWGYLDTNPAQGVRVRNGKKVSRDRFLQSDELPRFFRFGGGRAERHHARLHSAGAADRRTTGESVRNALERNRPGHGSVWRIPRTKNGSRKR
jgi:hypothetical protein